jgi:hypothetical protein
LDKKPPFHLPPSSKYYLGLGLSSFTYNLFSCPERISQTAKLREKPEKLKKIFANNPNQKSNNTTLEN